MIVVVSPKIGGQEDDGPFTVLAWKRTYEDEALVLVNRPFYGATGVQEYIVWHVNLHDGSCHSGFYTFEKDEAIERFRERSSIWSGPKL